MLLIVTSINGTQMGHFLHPWLKRVHDILNSYGLSYVWIDQDFRNINWLKTCINDTLKKQYV